MPNNDFLTDEEVSQKAKAIRREIVTMLTESASGHPGGSLSLADIMATLYFREMKVDPTNPQWEDRDRLVLCKGHSAPALYAALALKGFFPQEWLMTLRKLGSHLQGHPDMRKVPGVDMSTGSLGQGLSAACGMALSAKLDQQTHHIFAIIGDGESQEGQVWEAAMFAAHYKLNNLIAFLDHNGLQIDGKTTDVLSPEPLDKKFQAFGWKVIQIDGHNIAAISRAIHQAYESKDQPTLILANTIKGKGVSFMENQASWHGTAPKIAERDQALQELA